MQEVELDVGELAERAGDRRQPAPSRSSRPARGSASITALPRVGRVGGAQERVGLGEGGVDDRRVIAAPAAALERRDRRRAVARAGDHDEVVGDADDPHRARDLLAGRLAGNPLPSQRSISCPSARGHRVGHVQPAGEQRRALAHVRRHQRRPPAPPGERAGEQAGALGQRPVVGQPPDEVAQVLGGLGDQAEHLRAAQEVDLVAPGPAREVAARPPVQPTCASSAT